MKPKSKLGTTCSITMARHSRIVCAARHLLLLVLLALPAVVQAQYNYTTNNGTITITDYFGPGGAVTIPSTINGLPVTRIGDYAFQYNPNLTSVTIPNSVTNIGDGAFTHNTSLTSVTIGSSVTSIGGWVFRACTSLTAITVDALNSAYSSSLDGVLFDKSQTTLIQCPGGKAGSYTIPNSVTIIGSFAFSSCTSLTNVTIGNSVTSIGGWVFGGCTSLTGVTIGSSVTNIGDSAFYRCTSLTSVTIPNSVTSIADGGQGDFGFVYGTFSECTSLANVTIGNSVTNIGRFAFYYCTNLTSVTIGNSVTSIGGSAFYYCTSLTNVTIPNSVTSIGGGAFAYCTSLTSVTIPNSVTSIGESAFNSCNSLTSITIPNSVTSIGDSAFYSCTSLTSVTIGNSVTSIGEAAFYDCTSLTAITVDALNSVYNSVDGVLFNKSQTTLIQYPGGKAGSYTIPNSVADIGSAFTGCTSLTSVTIPNSVTSIAVGAFGRCSSLTAITVDALNSACSSVDGVLFNKSQTTIIQYPGGKAGSYTIPSSVTSIGDLAFSSCTSLTSVTLGNSVTSMGIYAFADCTSLTSVTIGNGVTSIGREAFFSCTSLTSVTIPNSVTSIGVNAFYYCTSLTGLYFHGNAPSVGLNVFEYPNISKATIYYLPGTRGWGATFAGRPTAPWLPEARTTDADFGVRTNQFGFNIRWASDKVVVVEASPDLSNPVWTPVSTNTLTGGSSYFSDLQWANHPTRFYRLRSP